jgi:hypothetical protein
MFTGQQSRWIGIIFGGLKWPGVLLLSSDPLDHRGQTKVLLCNLLFATMAMLSSTTTIFQFASVPFEFECCLLLWLPWLLLLLPLLIFLVVGQQAVPLSVDFSAHNLEYLGFEIIGPKKRKGTAFALCRFKGHFGVTPQIAAIIC